MTRPFAHVVFCDDVRFEMGGKRTFVGVYGTELCVPEIPTLIPKFYAVTTLVCCRGEIPKTLSVSLTYGDEEISKIDLTEEELEDWRVSSEEELAAEVHEFPADDPPKVRLGIEIFISPFVIREAARLATHVTTDMGSMRAGSIKIVQKDGVESTALPFPRGTKD